METSSSSSSSTLQEDGPPPKRKKLKYVERDPAKKDLAALPINVLLNIFKFLDVKSITNCAMLCSTFNNISKDGSLYKKIQLKSNMNINFVESLVNKVSCPKDVYIEYKSEVDCVEFNHFVRILISKSGEHVLSLQLEGCKNEEVLNSLSECINLKRLELTKCKGSFKSLLSICTLTRIRFESCHFPQKVVSDIIKNNASLKFLFLSNNINVNINEICDNMPTYNVQLKTIHLSERKRLKAKSIKCLARLHNLKSLELIAGSCGFECDPEDSLEQLAAGCPKLEHLAIYGWTELNDDNFIPALHMFTQLKELDLRGINITIKTCREAVLTLPLLKMMDVIKCKKVKRAQLSQLQKDFIEIDIPLE